MREKIEKFPRHYALGGKDTSGGMEQNVFELEQMCIFMKEKKIQTYLEIGCAHGYLLRFMENIMLLDVDGITPDKKPTHYLLPIYYGYSQDKDIISKIGNYDFIFVDGDHSYEGVKADYENYKGKCKYMGFHDCEGFRDCEGVKQLWSEIKDSYEHWYFVDDNKNIASGIGIIKIK